MNLETTIKQASQILKKHNIHTYELDAQLILSDIMKVERESLITNNEAVISEKIMEKYDIAIRRRIRREPVAYIIGKKEFWSHNFRVNHSTLIPRPESELLIYKLVNYFKNRRINILDIGTGSGCILLSLLKELHLSRGTGIDISSEAVKTAQLNSKKLNSLRIDNIIHPVPVPISKIFIFLFLKKFTTLYIKSSVSGLGISVS